jgi:hypothetical protein
MRTARLLGLVAVLGATLLVGCGGPSPEEWAAKVCGALAPWRTRINDLNADAQRALGAATGPAQARDGLVTLLTGAESATEQARQAIHTAGTPDVADGAEVARRFEGRLIGVRDAYGHARADIAALPTSDANAFYAKVATILNRLTTVYATSSIDTSSLDSPELRAAFDGVAQCR